MTFDDYQKSALRTAGPNRTGDIELCVRALGLCGETVELGEAIGTGPEAETKEAGDVLWYTATLASAFEVSGRDIGVESLVFLKPPIDKIEAFVNLWVATGKLAELVKKQVGHKKPADRTKVIDLLTQIVRNLAAVVPCVLADVAEQNIAKLKARYPSGFDVSIASAKADSDEKPGHSPRIGCLPGDV